MIAPLASIQWSWRRRDIIWRICYWTVLALIYAWAIWQRFTLPLDPIADPDTWGYLAPALRKLTGGEFGHTNGRNFLYPGFLFLLLRLFADFRAITIAQHLLGLCAGAFFLLTWKRARVLVPDPQIGRFAHDLLGLGGVAIFLLQWQTIGFEKEIRPEGICGFVLSITFYFLIQFVVCFFLENRRSGATTYAIALASSAILLASIKPSFAVASVLVLTPITPLLWRKGWSRPRVAFSFGVACVAALLFLPEYFLSRGDQMTRTFLPTMLFAVHADLIRDQLADDLHNHASVPYSRDRLERLYRALNSEITKSRAARPDAYPVLGFDPDYLMYDARSIASQARGEFGGDTNGLCAFYRFYYARIWQKQPLHVLEKVGRQFLIFYLPYCRAYDFGITQKFGDKYQLGCTSLSDPTCANVWTAYPPAVEFMQRTKQLSQDILRFQQVLIVPVAVFLLAIGYTSWLAIALLLAVMVAWSQRWGRLRVISRMVVFVYLFSAAVTLEVAVIESLEIRRYLTVQMYPALFAQLLGLWFMLEFVVQLFGSRRQGTRC
jgi:hypothetical protein